MKEPRQDKRSIMLREAARLFMATGYHGTSVDDIAAAARVSKAAVFYHFPSKSDILYEIYGTVVREMTSRIDGHPGDLTPSQRLHHVMRDVMEVVALMPVEVTVFYQEGPLLSSCLPRKQANELRAIEVKFTNYVIDAVEDGMNNGSMRRLDPTLTAYAFIAMVSWASRWYNVGGRSSAMEIADLFFSIGMQGLEDRPTEPDVGKTR
jgi:AcrR family transcriptional regulator